MPDRPSLALNPAHDARLWHPWLRINRLLRAMLTELWTARCVGVQPGDSLHLGSTPGGLGSHALATALKERHPLVQA